MRIPVINRAWFTKTRITVIAVTGILLLLFWFCIPRHLFNKPTSFIIDDDSLWSDHVALLKRLSALTKKDIVDFANQYFDNNYVCVYKRTGEDKDVVKVVKPPITPVEVNREAQSSFLKKYFPYSISQKMVDRYFIDQ